MASRQEEMAEEHIRAAGNNHYSLEQICNDPAFPSATTRVLRDGMRRVPDQDRYQHGLRADPDHSVVAVLERVGFLEPSRECG